MYETMFASTASCQWQGSQTDQLGCTKCEAKIQTQWNGLLSRAQSTRHYVVRGEGLSTKPWISATRLYWRRRARSLDLTNHMLRTAKMSGQGTVQRSIKTDPYHPYNSSPGRFPF